MSVAYQDPESGTTEDVPLEASLMEEIVSYFAAFFHDIKEWVGSMVLEERTVGAENRFFYDNEAKEWRLRGGETEAERASSRAIMTSANGELPGMRPAWRDRPSDAPNMHYELGGGQVPCPPPGVVGPPPVGIPINPTIRSAKRTSRGPGQYQDLSTYAHPVYAPKGFSGSTSHADSGVGNASTLQPPPVISAPFGAPPKPAVPSESSPAPHAPPRLPSIGVSSPCNSRSQPGGGALVSPHSQLARPSLLPSPASSSKKELPQAESPCEVLSAAVSSLDPPPLPPKSPSLDREA